MKAQPMLFQIFLLFKLQPDFYGFLQASPPDLYIERFNVALGQYMGALQSIVPLFIYMVSFRKFFSNKYVHTQDSD